MTRFAITLLQLYQRTISPDHGWWRTRHPYGCCRFYPSCSSYAIDSLRKHGLVRGFLKSMVRVLRCNPWNQGGVDPVT